VRVIRIATRGSRLALRQSEIVAGALRAAAGEVGVELAAITTRGDRHRGPLAQVGGKGLFTRELEDALRAGRVQLAVHSAKDLPAAMDEDFAIAAVPPRDDPRDAIVSRHGGLARLPAGARTGTSSLRRRAQLLAARGDLEVVAVRGNVETRLNKALGEPDEGLDAVVLAMAGLKRSGLAERHGRFIHPLSVEDFVPAAGQGILAIQALASDSATAELVAPLDDLQARGALLAERRLLRELGADCHSCVAIHVAPAESGWVARGMAARPDGADRIRLTRPGGSADEAADALLRALCDGGVAELLREG
jgi:hydroxymethylbilane synthase